VSFRAFWLDRGDGKCPDGIAMYAFKHGNSSCWDCICVHTYAFTHVNQSAVQAESADEAKAQKRSKYRSLTGSYLLEPIAMETSGTYGESTRRIINEIEKISTGYR